MNINSIVEKTAFQDSGYFTIRRKVNACEITPIQHSHKNIEICYFLEGSGTFSIGDNMFAVKNGDIIIINSNTRHKFFYAHENMYLYIIMFSPEFIDENLADRNDFWLFSESSLFRDFLNGNITQFVYHITPIVQDEFYSLYLNLYREYTQKRRGYRILLRTYMIELIAKIIRNISSENIDTVNINHSHNEAVSIAIAYMKKHYMERITLDDLARETSFSKNYLCRIFKETMSKTVFEYLNELRISEACKLLHCTSRTLFDISVSVGFTDYKGFANNLQRVTGKKPSQYRKLYDI